MKGRKRGGGDREFGGNQPRKAWSWTNTGCHRHHLAPKLGSAVSSGAGGTERRPNLSSGGPIPAEECSTPGLLRDPPRDFGPIYPTASLRDSPMELPHQSPRPTQRRWPIRRHAALSAPDRRRRIGLPDPTSQPWTGAPRSDARPQPMYRPTPPSRRRAGPGTGRHTLRRPTPYVDSRGASARTAPCEGLDSEGLLDPHALRA